MPRISTHAVSTAAKKAAEFRKQMQRMQRARELCAHADLLKIEIGWEFIDGQEHTTFKPLDIDPRFIEEATILSAEIKYLREKQNRR